MPGHEASSSRSPTASSSSSGRHHAHQLRQGSVRDRADDRDLPAFLAFAVIPFDASVTLFGRTVPFQIADLDIGILWVLAMTSIGIYAIVLAR